ncbi:hypothetical protein EDB83DRAFT_1804685 [Lactarius deliciosus]|nr:hypothetical protein EDB83DRAFT_1804685 [Lactarius deliciosus]
MEPVLGKATGLRALSFRIHRWPRIQHYCRSNPIYMPERGYKSQVQSALSLLVSDPRRRTEMFNNSTGQQQPQITPASHSSSNRSSRTPNETPSSRSAFEFEATLHEGLLTDSRNQGHGQSLGRGTQGYPIPYLPMYTNFWNGASWFPGPSTGNASGNSSGSDASGYPPALAYGQPIPPNFESGQTGEHRGMFYGGPPVAVATTNRPRWLQWHNSSHPPLCERVSHPKFPEGACCCLALLLLDQPCGARRDPYDDSSQEVSTSIIALGPGGSDHRDIVTFTTTLYSLGNMTVVT